MDEPKDEERWEGVAAAANESEAALIAGFLESRGIPARVVDRSFHQTPTESEDLSEIEVGVPAARVAEARDGARATREGVRRSALRLRIDHGRGAVRPLTAGLAGHVR